MVQLLEVKSLADIKQTGWYRCPAVSANPIIFSQENGLTPNSNFVYQEIIIDGKIYFRKAILGQNRWTDWEVKRDILGKG